jgi:predicted amidohydrolase
MKLKLAVCQMQIEQLKPEANLVKIEDYIKQASESRANIISFPEDFITGPILSKKDFVDFDNNYVEKIQELAKKYQIDIVAGSIIEGDERGWYNTSHYIDSNGQILGTYRKVRLWDPEVSYLQSGGEVTVFDTKYGRISLSICYDLAFPEIYRIMEMKNVEIIFCVSYWTEWHEKGILKYNQMATSEFVNSLTVARAIENCSIFVYNNAAGIVNFGGTDEILMGHSQIAVPFIGSYVKLEHNKEELLVKEVDTDILNEAQEAYKARSLMKKDAHLRLKHVLDNTF